MSEPAGPASRAQGSPPKKPFWRNPYVIALFIGMVYVTVISRFMRHIPDPPPILGKLPEFTLVDQSGKPFGSQDLRGQVYVANLFFTKCPSVCPLLMQRAAKLQELFKRDEFDIRLVSISIDPETDTPEVLADYGKKFGVEPGRWTLLTGPEPEIRNLVMDGFKLHLGEKEALDNDLYDIAHAIQFILVDREGNVRGYYGSDETGLDETYHRSMHVLFENYSK